MRTVKATVVAAYAKGDKIVFTRDFGTYRKGTKGIVRAMRGSRVQVKPFGTQFSTLATVTVPTSYISAPNVVTADADYTAKFAMAAGDALKNAGKAIMKGDEKKAYSQIIAALKNTQSTIAFMGGTAEPKSIAHLRKAIDALANTDSKSHATAKVVTAASLFDTAADAHEAATDASELMREATVLANTLKRKGGADGAAISKKIYAAADGVFALPDEIEEYQSEID